MKHCRNRPFARWRWAWMLFALLLQPLVSSWSQTPVPPVSIVNVIPARSNTTQPDEDGEFPAVIVLRNNLPADNANSINLAGSFLTDDAANLAKWQFPELTILLPQTELIVFASGKDRRPSGGDGRLHSNFTYPCDVPFAALVSPRGAILSDFSKPDASCAETCNGIFNSDTLARYFVPRDASLQTIWMQPGFNDGEWNRGTLGIGYEMNPNSPTSYAPLIQTDVVEAMNGINPSIYIRIPFSISNPNLAGKMDVLVNYDDGFIMYLNGVEVARRNAPSSLFAAFNATSIGDRPDAEALVQETIPLTGKLGALVPGQNVLAIQGLNSRVDAERFVIRPQICIDESETRDCPKTSRGRDFWLAFPGNAPDYTNNPLHLTVCISGVPGTTGQVEVPGLGFSQAFTIPANGAVAGTGTATVELPAEATLNDSGLIERKGVHVRASRDVAVYATSRIDYSTDTFLALPTECLGTDYLALGYKNVWTNLSILNGTQFGIVAVFDGTRVRIDPSTSRAGGAPFEIVLNRGETYLLRNTADAPADLSGASIRSNVRVGVFAGHRCANVNGQDIFFCNIALEQLLPTPAWGTDFVTAPFRTRTHSTALQKGDTLRVVAAQNNTSVNITDSTGANNVILAAGQVHEQLVIGAARVVSQIPVLASLYSSSSDFDSVVNADPFMALVQPVSGWLNRYLVCAPPTPGGTSDFESNYVNIIVRTNEGSLVRVDGVPVSGFQPAPFPGFEFAQVVLNSSVDGHLIDSPRGVRFAVTVYGYSEYDGYGYPGGFGFAQGVPVSIVCPQDIVLEAGDNCQAELPDLRESVQVYDPCADEGTQEPVCFGFEDLVIETTFDVGDTFTTSESGQSVAVTVAPFFFSDGQSFSNGVATVRNDGNAGGSGNEFQVSNVNLVFNPSSAWPGLSILFADQGGNINLSVNGVLRNENDLLELDGAIIGGARVSVVMLPGTSRGEVRIAGSIAQFGIGGQEFFIDQLCVGEQEVPETECFDFEDLEEGSEFHVGDSFNTSSSFETVNVTLAPFFFSDGQSFSNGVASVETGGNAGSTGQEIQVNNIRLVFKPSEPWPGLSILFGEFGGNVNLSVNGEVRESSDFFAFHGAVIGGAELTVTAIDDGPRGIIRVTGSVSEFDIGGQELFIDQLCVSTNEPPAQDCFGFNDIKEQSTFSVDQSFTTSNSVETVTVTMAPFFFTDGQSTSDGAATIRTGGQAGGTGHEVQVSNIRLIFKPATPWQGLSILYGDFGGNVNLSVNGEVRVANDLPEFNGTVLGGATITVIPTAGTSRGEIRVSGTVSEFDIGGQEFFIDKLCPGNTNQPPVLPCFEFEDLPLETLNTVGQSFTTTGEGESLAVTIAPFAFSNGQVTSNGTSIVRTGGQAGGTGKELGVNNVNVLFRPAVAWPGLSILYGDFGGNINLSVNGVQVNAEDFLALNGTNIGGARITVVAASANPRGEIRISGTVRELSIGGQEFAIDRLCVRDFTNDPRDGGVGALSAGIVVSQTPPPGTQLPAGEHEVVLVVRGPNRQLIGTCVARVVVLDHSPVKIECPQSIVVPCNDDQPVQVFYEGVRAFTETCGQPVSMVCEPPSGSFFPPGTTMVRCRAMGPQGDLAECTFPVHVQCDEPRLTFDTTEPGRLTISWQSIGVLETAADVTGPWETVVDARSGHTVQMTDKTRFFRVLFPNNPPE